MSTLSRVSEVFTGLRAKFTPKEPPAPKVVLPAGGPRPSKPLNGPEYV